jgi:hypothetical protein
LPSSCYHNSTPSGFGEIFSCSCYHNSTPSGFNAGNQFNSCGHFNLLEMKLVYIQITK